MKTVYGYFRQGITTEKWKPKTTQVWAYSRVLRQIPVHSDIFMHSQLHSGIKQTYSEFCVTLVYSEPWHIQYWQHIQKPAKHLRQSVFCKNSQRF